MQIDAPIQLTEWDWLGLQLSIHSLKREAALWSVVYNLSDSPPHINCLIWCDTTQGLIDNNSSIDEHRKFYDTWIRSQKSEIGKLLAKLPVLGQEFDTTRDVTYEILYSYGMGSSLVCEYTVDGFFWRYPQTPPLT